MGALAYTLDKLSWPHVNLLVKVNLCILVVNWLQHIAMRIRIEPTSSRSMTIVVFSRVQMALIAVTTLICYLTILIQCLLATTSACSLLKPRAMIMILKILRRPLILVCKILVSILWQMLSLLSGHNLKMV